MSSSPTVSVVIPVFNRFELLEQTVQSVLAQTYEDLELILVDDFSTDGTRERLQELCDPRIRIELNPENRGAGATRNAGLDAVTTEFVALTDQDDLWHPQKLEKQVLHLIENPDCVLVGTHATTFSVVDGQEHDGVTFAHPASDGAIREFMFYSSPFVSSTVMLRTGVVNENNLRFRTDMGKSSCEDYDMWRRLSRYGKLANIPESLLRYREHETQQSRLREDEMRRYSNEVRRTVLQDQEIELTERQFSGLVSMGRYESIEAQGTEVPETAHILLNARAKKGREATRIHLEMFIGTLLRSKLSKFTRLKMLLKSRSYQAASMGMMVDSLRRILESTPFEL